MDEEVYQLVFEELLEELVIRFETVAMERQAKLDGIIINLERQGIELGTLVELQGASTLVNAEIDAFGNAILSNLVGGTRQAAQLGLETYQKTTYTPGQEYRWQTESGNPCPDCVGRSGYEPMTMEEWEAIGTPKTGATICGSHCMCVLVPQK